MNLQSTDDLEDRLSKLIHQADTLSSYNMRDKMVERIYKRSKQLTNEIVSYTGSKSDDRTERLDSIFTSTIWGFPIMLTMLRASFYLTIAGEISLPHF